MEVVPIAVAVDGEPLDERLPIDAFYARLLSGAVATTSQPSPARFAKAYERAASAGAESVVSIHLDARTSGTIDSARSAAHDARIPVTVVDTHTVSYGVAVCVRAAATVVASGGGAREAADAAARLGRSMENAFVARSGAGGRVPVARGWALLQFARGAVSTTETCRAIGDAVQAMARHVLRAESRVAAAVGHAGREMEAAADAVAHAILDPERVPTVERYRVGAAVGAHTGSESMGVFWWPDP